MNWNDEDKIERCPQCNSITYIERVRGINKQNIKRLFSWSWDWKEMTILFLMISILAMAWLYSIDTKECREWVTKLHADPFETCEILKNEAMNRTNVWNESMYVLNFIPNGTINSP